MLLLSLNGAGGSVSLLRAPARPQGLRGSERQGRPPVRTADLGERLPLPPARCVPAKLPHELSPWQQGSAAGPSHPGDGAAHARPMAGTYKHLLKVHVDEDDADADRRVCPSVCLTGKSESAFAAEGKRGRGSGVGG